MTILQNLLIRIGLKRISQQDVAQGIREKDISLLKLIIRFGSYRVRKAAVLGLGKVRDKSTVPELIRLLWDDFESVARAARQSLQVYLPDTQVERQLRSAETFWTHREEQRSLKRKAIWFDTNNPLQPQAPMIDRSKMHLLAKIKVQLQKPIRF
ncbi:HEAT repeat domain-containing protein [Flavilitoribacter nigricans]|uniref:HEAT repeat domain-containing protein n=1 Tax=Flavilitoribacter nigricans (strain ATCC 23147 / DSM 23189 / NBRC 102662 / NCIMB 1420 / SS-2) TaxID=1122177 RepID=A0A2D0NG94_FLAN2|nr:HEAT repeat domain-containing protein [Flavilitoribacter nigricans]PHN07189.1 hypothetical protein CRP01_08160 [Flavilitoribacter nigricans DSM 23189 = NBRC 102662]